jgi:hypothetical protein
MTAQPPQREYIITEEQLQRGHEIMSKTGRKKYEREIRIRPHTPAPKFNSEDLILLAHDEWKRREERKHNHPEQDWVAGYLNGFCTSRKWAREYVDKLRSKK